MPGVAKPKESYRGVIVLWTVVVILFVVPPLLFWPRSEEALEPASQVTSARESTSGLTGLLVGPKPELPPSNRFRGVPEDSPMRPVQDHLNAGNVNEAGRLLYSREVTPEMIKSDVGRKLEQAVNKAFTQLAGGETKAASEIERIGTYWRPQLDAISPAEPQTAEEIWARVNAFNDLGLALHDSEDAELTPSEKRQRDQFRADLSAKQAKTFPVLRKAYVGLVKNGLWLDNVDAELRGESRTTLRLTGAGFASNRNVDELQRTNVVPLTKLRFKRSEYAWYKGSEFTFYKLGSPSDQAIGYTEGGTFVPVK